MGGGVCVLHPSAGHVLGKEAGDPEGQREVSVAVPRAQLAEMGQCKVSKRVWKGFCTQGKQ